MTLDPTFFSLFILSMTYWDNAYSFLSPTLYSPEDNKMRCTIDGLFGCEHMRKRQSIDHPLSSPMSRASKVSYPIRVEDTKVRIATEAETQSITNPMRVLVPPPVSLTPPSVSTALRSSEEPKVIVQNDDKVICQVCQISTDILAITAHLKGHMEDTKPANMNSRNDNPRALARVNTPILPQKVDVPLVRLSSKERYEARPISAISFSSSTGRDGRYSDFSIMLWETARQSLNDHTYAHSAYAASSSPTIQRFHIIVVYDALEDYYHLSAKLLKKSWMHESDEGSIPDRICSTPQELFTEIRRALIYFRINPRIAYRLFRKMQRKDKFVSETDKNGRVIATQTSNTEALLEQLKSTQSTNSAYSGCYG